MKSRNRLDIYVKINVRILGLSQSWRCWIIETIISILIGLFLIFIGFLVLKKRALFLVNIVLWNGVSGDEKLLSRIFGIIIMAAGFLAILLPFLMSN